MFISPFLHISITPWFINRDKKNKKTVSLDGIEYGFHPFPYAGMTRIRFYGSPARIFCGALRP